MTVMSYTKFIESNQSKTESDRFIEYLNKNKYFEIPFISKNDFSSEDNWRKDITGGLNSVMFDTSFHRPLGISWIKVEPYLGTFQGISDQIKGIVRIIFSDESKKLFAVTIDGITKGKTWFPEIVRIQNHNIAKTESFNITDRSVQIYGATNPDSVTPEPTERPKKRFKRVLDMAKAKFDKLKTLGTGRNKEEETTEDTN